MFRPLEFINLARESAVLWFLNGCAVHWFNFHSNPQRIDWSETHVSQSKSSLHLWHRPILRLKSFFLFLGYGGT